jgi:integrase
MPWDLMPNYMAKLGERGDMLALTLDFAIRSALRIEPVLELTVAHLDREKCVLTVPAQFCKRKTKHKHVPHILPLTDAMLTLIDRAAGLRGSNDPGDQLFPHHYRSKKGVENAVRMLAKGVLDGNDAITTHGFRSSFSDWVGEATDWDVETREFALGHIGGDDTVEAYRRGSSVEKRRRLMQAWGNYLDGIAVDNVVAIGARK